MSSTLLVFLGVMILGTFATIFIDLSWGVFLYVLIYFLFPVNRWWYTIPNFRYTFFIALLLLVVFLIKKDQYRDTKLTNFTVAKWLLFMVILMVVQSFYAVWPTEHQKFLILQVKQLTFLLLAFKIIDSSQKLDNLLMTYIAGIFYIGYLAFDVGRISTGRVEGIGMPDSTDVNGTAAVLVTAIPIIFYFILKGKNWQRVLCLLMLPFILNSYILFNSRGAFVGLIVGMAFYVLNLFINKKFFLKEGLYFVTVAILLFFMFLYLTDATFWRRMETLVSLKDVEITDTSSYSEADIARVARKTGAARIYFWLASIDLVKQYPFGTGAGGFEYLSPQLVPGFAANRDTGRSVAHSTYFQALNDFGYIGIILICGFLYSSFALIRKVKRHLKFYKKTKPLLLALSLESSFFTYLVAITFINRLYAEVFYWSMLFIACFANLNLFLPEIHNDPVYLDNKSRSKNLTVN